MLALVRRNLEFAGIISMQTHKEVDGITVCIGDVVKVSQGSYYNECEGMVAIFIDNIGVMGLGTIPISELTIEKIITSHKDLSLDSTLDDGIFQVRKFRE